MGSDLAPDGNPTVLVHVAEAVVVKALVVQNWAGSPRVYPGSRHRSGEAAAAGLAPRARRESRYGRRRLPSGTLRSPRVESLLLERRTATVVTLIVALAASAILIIALSWKLTFYQDTWLIVIDRQGWSLDNLLLPHNEHLIAFQIAAEKLFFELFGIGNNHAETLLATAVLLAAAGLLFAWARKRVDPWLAVFGVSVLLFLGAAWQTLLWPFEMAFTVPLMFGLAMLLSLEREDRRGDVGACLLLILSLFSGSLGISFAAAAFVAIVVEHRRLGWSRLFVVAIPALLYFAWYLHYGKDVEHHLSLENVLASPRYVFEGFATAFAALVGLGSSGIGVPVDPALGRPLLIAAVAAAIYAVSRRRGFPASFWAVLAASFSYWFLAAFNFIPGREAASPRYVYIGVVFVLMIGAELLRGYRPGGRTLAVIGVLAGLAILPNLGILKEGYEFFREATVITKADTGALEIARRTVAPQFALTEEVAGTSTLESVEAGPYLEAVDAFGPAGYSPAELTIAPEVGRRQADIALAAALPIDFAVAPAGAQSVASNPSCSVLQPGDPAEQVPIGPGKTVISLAPGAPASVSLRRFAATEFPVQLGTVEGDSVATVTIPRDVARQPWYVRVEAGQKARVCPTGG
ncbi:MAG: hypothetical protein AB7V58_07565 [Solirubrobacterales bacterium]